MADVGVQQNWLVSPTNEIEEKWIDVAIQERKSRIARHLQDIEDLKRGKIVELEAKIMMLQRELQELEKKRDKLKPIDVDINNQEEGGTENG